MAGELILLLYAAGLTFRATTLVETTEASPGLSWSQKGGFP